MLTARIEISKYATVDLYRDRRLDRVKGDAAGSPGPNFVEKHRNITSHVQVSDVSQVVVEVRYFWPLWWRRNRVLRKDWNQFIVVLELKAVKREKRNGKVNPFAPVDQGLRERGRNQE